MMVRVWVSTSIVCSTGAGPGKAGALSAPETSTRVAGPNGSGDSGVAGRGPGSLGGAAGSAGTGEPAVESRVVLVSPTYIAIDSLSGSPHRLQDGSAARKRREGNR